jgi:hypothetical protein
MVFKIHITVLLLVVIGCVEIGALPPDDNFERGFKTFTHEYFNRVLERFVDNQGQVNYKDLKEHSENLDKYYQLLSSYSPDSHPDLFPTEPSKLAYWLNAYNAAAIKIVLTHYQISSVKDVKPPRLLFFLPRESGFFLFQRVTIGGKKMSLYSLENNIIRKRFSDPRVHFALNCASRGCPRLPRRAFHGSDLTEVLDNQRRIFLSESRNVTFDHEKRTVFLSSIFDWYKDDFLEWYQETFPHQKATLLDYVSLYISSERGEEIRREASYQIHFLPYDWSLNDQKDKGL